MSKAGLIAKLKIIFKSLSGTADEKAVQIGGDIYDECVSVSSKISDADGDTKVECEKNADEDIIRLTANGNEIADIIGSTTRLSFKNGKYLAFEDSGGTSRATLYSSGDNLLLTWSANGNFFINNNYSNKDIVLRINDGGAVSKEVLRIVGAESSVKISNIKSGATQIAAGATAGELWKTSGHASLPDNVIMIGV